MSETPLPALPVPSAPAAPAQELQWITVEQAAQLMNISDRHARRQCGEIWLRDGKARLDNEPGRKSQWFVRGDADPRLQVALQLSGKQPPRVEPIRTGNLMKNTAALSKAQFKAAILTRWERALEAGRSLGLSANVATTAFLTELAREFLEKNLGKCPDRSTLYNWQKAARAGEGIEGLQDGRQLKNADLASARENDPFFECVKRLYLTENQNKLSKCYDTALYMARDQGWELRSRSQVRRFVESIDRREKVLKREGKEAFINKIMPHEIGDYSTMDSNELWVSDHHQFDVWARTTEKLDAKTGQLVPIHNRCWLTVWMDMRSRKVTGFVIRPHAPNTDVILQALAIGCESNYVPFGVYSDNGKDYDSRVLTGETKKQYQARRGKKNVIEVDEMRLLGIYGALRIKHQRALPYHPQSKPVERFFRTVCDRFSRTWETYCGGSPQERPEGLEGRLERGLAPSLEEFTAAFGKWLEADYHHRIHTGDSMDDTPHNVWQANLRTMRTAPRELLDLLMQPRHARRVNQLGVEHNKITYGRYLLNQFIGQDVYIRVNNSDVSSVSVWSVKDEFICVAPTNSKLPRNADSTQVRAAITQQRDFAKTLTKAYQAELRKHYDVPMLMLAAAADQAEAQQAASPTPPTPDGAAYQPVRSDMETQLKALQSAYEDRPLRMAAGAESMSLAAAEAAYGVDE